MWWSPSCWMTNWTRKQLSFMSWECHRSLTDARTQDTAKWTSAGRLDGCSPPLFTQLPSHQWARVFLCHSPLRHYGWKRKNAKCSMFNKSFKKRKGYKYACRLLPHTVERRSNRLGNTVRKLKDHIKGVVYFTTTWFFWMILSLILPLSILLLVLP